jgi:hypothetical protein
VATKKDAGDESGASSSRSDFALLSQQRSRQGQVILRDVLNSVRGVFRAFSMRRVGWATGLGWQAYRDTALLHLRPTFMKAGSRKAHRNDLSFYCPCSWDGVWLAGPSRRHRRWEGCRVSITYPLPLAKRGTPEVYPSIITTCFNERNIGPCKAFRSEKPQASPSSGKLARTRCIRPR